MKITSQSLPSIAVCLLTAAVFAATATAQAPSPGGQGMHNMPAPTNLKVLPKNITNEQLHKVMEGWAGSLGVHCNTCHAAAAGDVGPNGRPRLNFAADSKPQKATARLMYKMTKGINKDYVSKIEGAEKPVTCGTCHRGHLDPEPFVIPEEEHHPPAAGSTPPTQH